MIASLSGPALSDDVLASLSGDFKIDGLEDAFNFDVADDLGEYSVTPDDVKDLMTRW